MGIGCLHSFFWVFGFLGLVIGAILLGEGNFIGGGISLAVSMFFFWQLRRSRKIEKFKNQTKNSSRSSSNKATKGSVEKLDRVKSKKEKSWTGKLDKMDGYEFEKFVAKLFEEMGYSTRVTKQSGDQGVDVIAETPFETLAIQAKKYSNNVSNSAIQEVVAAKKPSEADKAVVVTTSDFTKSAKDLASANSVRLVNKSELLELIDEFL